VAAVSSYRVGRFWRDRSSFVVLLWALFAAIGCSEVDVDDREFTIVAYNVENLFDLDGVAIFDDYRQDEPQDIFTYGRLKLLTKLQNTASVLKHVNKGTGPEIILFQELEADFTPETSVEDFDQFLKDYSATTVAEMLGAGWRSEYAGLPSAAWLLKSLSDAGLKGYSIVLAPAKPLVSGIAHTNAVFSKFPMVEMEAHPVPQARDILEVEIDIDGHPLFIYANHWKSGASDPEREPIRVQNAAVLRGLIDARLANDSFADIVIGGDLNSHYNHSKLYPQIETGINDVLGSQGDELAIRDSKTVDLYNLWYELPPKDRYSDVWRGRRGTLMHLLLARGLYDQSGIRYIDGSFDKLVLPGLNADALGRPLAWNFVGATGGGVSDHFPVAARFSIGEGARGAFIPLKNPSNGRDALDFEMPLGFVSGMQLDLMDGAFLSNIDDSALGPYVDKLYAVDARVLKTRSIRLEVAGLEWDAYAPNKSVYERLRRFKGGKSHRLAVKLGMWKGQRQFVVEGIL
jgi:hypothetical protein